MQAGARAQPVATSLPLEEQGSADQRNIQSMPHGMQLGSRFSRQAAGFQRAVRRQEEQLMASLLTLLRCGLKYSRFRQHLQEEAVQSAQDRVAGPEQPCIFMMQQLKASSGMAGCGHLIPSVRPSSFGAASFCDAHHPRGARGHYGRRRGQGARAVGPAEKNLVLDNSYFAMLCYAVLCCAMLYYNIVNVTCYCIHQVSHVAVAACVQFALTGSL